MGGWVLRVVGQADPRGRLRLNLGGWIRWRFRGGRGWVLGADERVEDLVRLVPVADVVLDLPVIAFPSQDDAVPRSRSQALRSIGARGPQRSTLITHQAVDRDVAVRDVVPDQVRLLEHRFVFPLAPPLHRLRPLARVASALPAFAVAGVHAAAGLPFLPGHGRRPRLRAVSGSTAAPRAGGDGRSGRGRRELRARTAAAQRALPLGCGGPSVMPGP